MAAGFCPKNSAFAPKIMALSDSGGWLVRLCKSFFTYCVQALPSKWHSRLLMLHHYITLQVKSNWRNKLGAKSLEHLLRIKLTGPECTWLHYSCHLWTGIAEFSSPRPFFISSFTLFCLFQCSRLNWPFAIWSVFE